MDTKLLLGFGVVTLALVGALFMILKLTRRSNRVDINSLRGSLESDNTLKIKGRDSAREAARAEQEQQQLATLRKKKEAEAAKFESNSLEDLFFQAGFFFETDVTFFTKFRTIAPFVFATLGFVFGMAMSDATYALLIAVIAGLVGFRLPYMYLDRKKKQRSEDILFYLPLVIEQLVIGVSSSLDIGPCVARVVSMADERDSHNCVTELLGIVQNYVRSGMSLEDALIEVGRRSGHNELKHAFLSLSQVAKHGGEVTRQLQELADAVANQREAKIETKIKKLELEATVPVAVVFCGFLIILLSGFGLQIKKAFM